MPQQTFSLERKEERNLKDMSNKVCLKYIIDIFHILEIVVNYKAGFGFLFATTAQTPCTILVENYFIRYHETYTGPSDCEHIGGGSARASSINLVEN